MGAARGGGAQDAMDESKGGRNSGSMEEGGSGGLGGRALLRRGGDSSAMEEGGSGGLGGRAHLRRGDASSAMEEGGSGGLGGRAQLRRGGNSSAMEEGSGGRTCSRAELRKGVGLAAMEEARGGGKPGSKEEATSSGGPGAREEQISIDGSGSSSGKKRRRPEQYSKESMWIKREGIRREKEMAEFKERFPDFEYVSEVSDSDIECSWDSDATCTDDDFVPDSGPPVCPLCKQIINPTKGGTGGELVVQIEGGGGDVGGTGGKLTVKKSGAGEDAGWVTVRKGPASRIGN